MARKRKSKQNGTLQRNEAEHDGSPQPGSQAAGSRKQGQAEKAPVVSRPRDQVRIVVNRGTAETVPGTAKDDVVIFGHAGAPEKKHTIAIEGEHFHLNNVGGVDEADQPAPPPDLSNNEERQAIAQYVGDEVFRSEQPKLSFYRVKDIAADYPPLELVLLAGVTTLSFKTDDERIILVDDAELNDAQVALNRAEPPLALDPLVEYIKLRTVRTQG